VGKLCFNEVVLAALVKNVLYICCLWQEFSVVFLHSYDVSLLKYLSYDYTTKRSLRRSKGSMLVLILHELVGVVLMAPTFETQSLILYCFHTAYHRFTSYNL
jgi:hypothetical protein